MRIAVNTRSLFKDHPGGYDHFIDETFSRITANHPEHEFIFIFDKPFDQRFIYGPNVKAVLIKSRASHPLFWRSWYDIRIPAILKEYKADVFVSCDGSCSLRTKVPQCMVVHDLAFLYAPPYMKRSHLHYYKKNTEKFLGKAKNVATISESARQELISRYKKNMNDIDVVYSAARSIFRPVNEDIKQSIKEKYTEGNEYWICTGAVHTSNDLVNLLKAFSAFKKRQKTGMKLLIASTIVKEDRSFRKSLDTFKYRNDVVMAGDIEEKELANIVGAAYALVYPTLFEGFAVQLLEAIQCEVPVITSSGAAMLEVAQNAALYADAANPSDLADKLMLLYKDEALRNKLIENGRQVIKEYNWDKTTALLWQSILKTCE